MAVHRAVQDICSLYPWWAVVKKKSIDVKLGTAKIDMNAQWSLTMWSNQCKFAVLWYASMFLEKQSQECHIILQLVGWPPFMQQRNEDTLMFCFRKGTQNNGMIRKRTFGGGWGSETREASQSPRSDSSTLKLGITKSSLSITHVKHSMSEYVS